MGKKTLAYILIGAAIAGVAVYFFMRRKSPAQIESEIPATTSEDDITYRKMRDMIAAKVTNIGWVLEEVKNLVQNGTMKDGRTIHPDYLVDGKITKSGALMAVYASSVASWAGEGETEDKALTNQLYTLFYKFKSNAIAI